MTEHYEDNETAYERWLKFLRQIDSAGAMIALPTFV